MDRAQLRQKLSRMHRSQERLDQVMQLIDQYVESLVGPRPEVWTADEVADYLGLKNRAAARATMSRNRIQSAQTICGQRTYAAYPADQVRALKEKQ